MKCLEKYTIEQIKEMTPEEIKVVWYEVVEEKQTMDKRHTIVEMIEIMEAKKPSIRD
jgi:hypothetical protein